MKHGECFHQPESLDHISVCSNQLVWGKHVPVGGFSLPSYLKEIGLTW